MSAENEYPRLSVITPSYNQAEYLERTIRSVLLQNYPNLQYIIIDGGSTDESLGIIKKYERYLDYWCSESDAGQSDAINKGLRRANGEWVAFQNSDDIYLPSAFATVADAARNPTLRADIIYGDLLHISADDRVLDAQVTIPTGIHGHFAQMQTQNQSVFWRRSLLELYGYFDCSMYFSFDFEYFGRLLKHAVGVMHVDTFLGAFRHQSESKTANSLSRARQDHVIIEKRYGGWPERYIPQLLRTFVFKGYKFGYCLLHDKHWYLLRRFDCQRKFVCRLQNKYSDWLASLLPQD